MAEIKLKNLFRNLKYFFSKDIKAEVRRLQSNYYTLKNDLLYNKIINCNDATFQKQYKQEIEYIKKLGYVPDFPYPQIKKIGEIESGYDIKLQLPYVVHYSKKLYFPSHFSVENARSAYLNFVEKENILGGNYSEKAPHQYQSDKFYVDEDDVLFDIGCAEALFALDVIEKVKKVYLFESNKCWNKPLKATFAPYKDKVVIVNKFVSDSDSRHTVRIDTVLKEENKKDNIFLKMDIEGNEKLVINASRDLLAEERNIKIACCTYHCHNDADEIKTFLGSLGYKTDFSDGYILFTLDNLQYPFFRKGVLHAIKQSQ